MREICVPCQKEYVIEKNGVVVTGYINGQPHKIYRSDKWKCPECGHEILSGFGQPIEHFDPRFRDMLKETEVRVYWK